MPRYIVLANWTQKGMENLKESPNRLDAARDVWRAMGGELKEFYLTMGQYDMALIVEAPDDETVAKIALATGAQGGVRTITLRAFAEDEYRQIMAALP